MSSRPDRAGSGALTLERMRRDIAEAIFLEPSEVGDEDDLIDLGLDSVRLMSLALRWQEAGASITFADLAEHTRLARWWTLLSGAASADR
jgi:aryl carrier-like protein